MIRNLYIYWMFCSPLLLVMGTGPILQRIAPPCRSLVHTRAGEPSRTPGDVFAEGSEAERKTYTLRKGRELNTTPVPTIFVDEPLRSTDAFVLVRTRTTIAEPNLLKMHTDTVSGTPLEFQTPSRLRTCISRRRFFRI